jgi:hypothetical protein
MMKITSSIRESERKNDWLDRILIGYVFLASLFYILASGRRFFNFDEFQVLYASAALLRGKALYADSIGSHFPLVNIFYSNLIYLAGFKATTLLIGRYFISIANGIVLFYVYRTGEFLWHKKAGLMAVGLTLAAVIFLMKGIEIRHDVFNTLFNVMGAYYALRYLKGKKYLHLVLSGLFCGLAVASTQKAMIWSVAIIAGVIFHFMRKNSFKEILKVVFTYGTVILLPLMICLAYLILVSNESVASVYKHSFINQIYSHTPSTPEMYPFLHNRFDLLKNLFFWNPLFYTLGFGGIFYFALSGLKGDTEKIVIVSWTVIGLLFYLTVKRPFYQSFLPTIPPLAIVTSGFLVWMGERMKNAAKYKKIVTGLLCALFLFAWPGYFMFDSVYGYETMGHQIDNVAFCLGSLKQDEKVMCLTQNQVFFDPVLEMYETDCGKNLVYWGADCFEKKMIQAQSKIVIYDYRTSILNKAVQKRIKDNYIYTGVGDILIPGFKIRPKMNVEKNIWIDGSYHIPPSSLLIDGKKIDGDIIRLRKKSYTIHNLSDKTVVFVYKFNKEEID